MGFWLPPQCYFPTMIISVNQLFYFLAVWYPVTSPLWTSREGRVMRETDEHLCPRSDTYMSPKVWHLAVWHLSAWEMATIIVIGMHNLFARGRSWGSVAVALARSGAELKIRQESWAPWASLGWERPQESPRRGALFIPAPGRPLHPLRPNAPTQPWTASAPLPTKDTKLVLSTSIQMPKQKIRLPRTWGEENIAGGRLGEMKWGGYGRGWGPGSGAKRQLTKKKRLKTKRRYLTRLRQPSWADIFS